MPDSSTTELSAPQMAMLASGEGERVLAEIEALAPTPATAIAVATRLRKHHPGDLVAAALTLYDLRRHASAKFSRAGKMYFTRAGLEQATSEHISTWRAQRYAPYVTIADLCCGIGGDLLALAQLPSAGHLLAVDLDPEHLAMAAANARLYAPGAEITLQQSDVRRVDLSGIESVFIDPARRNAGGRFGGSASEPPLDWCLDLADRVAAVGIKMAPGLPHELVPEGWEFEAIAIGPDLKEAALWSPALATTRRRATVITGDGVETIVPDAPGEAAAQIPIVEPAAGMWLHDPNPAVTRAGLVADLARQIGGAQIDEQIAFLVTEDQQPSPFARSLPIIASGPWNEKQVKQTLRALGAGPLDIRRRGLAGDVDAIGKRLRQKGTRPVLLVMTRYRGAPWALVCDDAPEQRR